MADLTGRSRPYDFHLAEAMAEQSAPVCSWVGGEGERTVQSVRGVRTPVINVASRLPLRWARLRKALKAAEYVINLGGLYRWASHQDVKVLHFQWLPLLEVLPALELFHLRWAQRNGIRVVHTVHNVLPHDTGDRHRAAYRAAYHCADALICHTQGARRALVDDFGVESRKVSVIPHGPLSLRTHGLKDEAESDSTPAGSGTAGHDASGDPMVVYFGRIRPYKGVKFLIRAWKHVQAAEPDARLVIAGSGPDGHVSEIADLIERLGLSDCIETRFYFLPDGELDRLLRKGNVLVYPYRSITQSGALLLGMQYGMPIVATRTGGLQEVIADGHNGLLVEYGDEQALAEHVVRLIGDQDLRARLSRKARRDVTTKYSWDVIAKKTLECYRKVDGDASAASIVPDSRQN
jgi:glycosyltransferase involved in cell wall biosynthesis